LAHHDSSDRALAAVRAALLTLVIVHAVIYGLQIPVLDEERLERDYWHPWCSASRA
jgi:hypothetical protein